MVERIGCFLKSAGVEQKLGYEEEMKFQRINAPICGERVDEILTSILERNLSSNVDEGGLERIRRQLSQALDSESGLMEGAAFKGDWCFQ